MSSSATPPRVRLEADARREQIVLAAQRLFAERPYEEVSTNEIAVAAGTTRTNIYYHFKTKRDLFLEIIQRFSQIPDDLGSGGGDGRAVERLVEEVLGRWLDVIERNRETFVTMLHASSSADPEVSGVLAGSMRAWETRLLVIVGLDLDNPSHHAMVRAYQAMVSDATAAWLERGVLTKRQVHSMLTRCLLALGASVREA